MKRLFQTRCARKTIRCGAVLVAALVLSVQPAGAGHVSGPLTVHRENPSCSIAAIGFASRRAMIGADAQAVSRGFHSDNPEVHD